jgi:hypothetical protein
VAQNRMDHRYWSVYVGRARRDSPRALSPDGSTAKGSKGGA